MKWNINRESRKDVDVKIMSVDFWNHSNEETQIVASAKTTLIVTDQGREIFSDRLSAEFHENHVTVHISNAKYTDSGEYRLEVQLTTKEDASASVTINVHGNFFLIIVSHCFMEFP